MAEMGASFQPFPFECHVIMQLTEVVRVHGDTGGDDDFFDD